MRAILLAALLPLFAGLQIADVLKDPAKYDKKTVEIAGKVEEFEQKTSKIGNKYVTFKVTQGDDWIHVYAKGTLTPPLKEGEKVTVKGRFFAENKVGTSTFKNEINLDLKKEDAIKRD